MKGLLYLVVILAAVYVTWTNREKYVHLFSPHKTAVVVDGDEDEAPSRDGANAGTAPGAAATPHPAREAQAQATALYPGLSIANSGLNQKFVALYKEAQANNPALLSQPDWPLTLADRAAVALGGAPMPRNRAAAAAPGRASKQVVIYTTSHCPYCIQAKQYFAKKGVAYREVDVETSAIGKQEFRRLGGNGVPLIMVNGTKVDGFDQKELDRLL